MQEALVVNQQMLSFVAFAVIWFAWVLWGFQMGFGMPAGLSDKRLFRQLCRQRPGVSQQLPERRRDECSKSGRRNADSSGSRSLRHTTSSSCCGDHADPEAGSVLWAGSLSKAWIPFVALWMTCRLQHRFLLILGRRLLRHRRHRLFPCG